MRRENPAGAASPERPAPEIQQIRLEQLERQAEKMMRALRSAREP